MKNASQLAKNIELIGRKVLIDAKNLKETGLMIDFDKPDDLKNDSFLAALTILNHFFMRGRKDELSNEYFNLTKSALSKIIEKEYSGSFNQFILSVDALINDVQNYFQKQTTKNTLNSEKRAEFAKLFEKNVLIGGLLNEKSEYRTINNDVDFRMIIGVLAFINKQEEKNVTNYCLSQIEQGKTEDLFIELKGIYGVGDKLASFYLRNLAALFIPEKNIAESEMKFFLPIDVWIVRVLKCFNNDESIYKNVTDNPDKAKEVMIKIMNENHLNPAAFNQGCWYVGYHSFDLLLECLSMSSYEGALLEKFQK